MKFISREIRIICREFPLNLLEFTRLCMYAFFRTSFEKPYAVSLCFRAEEIRKQLGSFVIIDSQGSCDERAEKPSRLVSSRLSSTGINKIE